MTPEGKVKAEHKEYFNAQGWYQYWPVPMGMGAPAIDCYLCCAGRFVGLETKKRGLIIPTARQADTIKRICKSGGLAFTSDSLKRTIDYLQQHALGLYNPEVG